MKKLLLIRHAHATYATDTDRNRPLSDKGHLQAAKMSDKLLIHNYRINKILVSNASRALETASYIEHTQQMKKEQVEIIDGLYLADKLQLIEAISFYGGDAPTLAIVAHNPGLSNLLFDYTIELFIQPLATASGAVLEVDLEYWSNFESAKKKFIEVF